MSGTRTGWHKRSLVNVDSDVKLGGMRTLPPSSASSPVAWARLVSKRTTLWVRPFLAVVLIAWMAALGWGQLPDNSTPTRSSQRATNGPAADSPARSAASSTTQSIDRGIRFGREQVQRLQVGVRIQAGGPCRGVLATFPVPMDWPEQQVEVVKEEISPAVRFTDFRVLQGGVRQMLVQIPRLDRGETAEALVTVQVRRRAILAPEQTDVYRVPTRLDRATRIFLGASPFIESRNARIRTIARQVTREKPTAWEQVEAIYDYVRDKVEYRESELKGAVQVLRDGVGDCEAMTSLFVALCRAHKVPSRMVWVTDHSYPEFYLMDDQGNGHWFPCQIAGARAFGSMPETRVILQKGDNFRIPEIGEQRRYVAVHLKAKAVRGTSPRVSEVMQYQ